MVIDSGFYIGYQLLHFKTITEATILPIWMANIVMNNCLKDLVATQRQNLEEGKG
ncbi:hypothetical protein [Streptococcus plurextorum]|uniref:hypothetical protein n=1 Tax=Streptococcus plurextorum TaxID=456876 RepID=UPI0003F73CFA|nr:hypothetical protein [Streptococcus plurextorum]